MAREHILKEIRSALNRKAGQACGEIPAVQLTIPVVELKERIRRFSASLGSLGGTTECVGSPAEACARAASFIGDKTAVVSHAPLLEACGIRALKGVRTAPDEEDALRKLCSSADLGITSADFALADTGSLVLLCGSAEARMISLLPPEHLAVISRDRILTNLDELYDIMPHPAELTSSMLVITGPSRTADIEQILIRRVHGPGDLHVIIL